MVLSTGIESAPTHWKQTVLWLREENRLQVKRGDKIVGMLRYDRLEENPREYSITLAWNLDGCSPKFSQVFGLRA